MRIQTIETESLEQAQDQAPWAAIICLVEGGFKCFESMEDYYTWKEQT